MQKYLFIRETGDYNILMYYEWQKADKILAFAAEINAVNGSRVMGNIYSLDFEKYCKHVQEAAVPARPTRKNRMAAAAFFPVSAIHPFLQPCCTHA